MKLGVTSHFNAAHMLPRHTGKCKNMHGHTYKVEIVVEGYKNNETQCIADFSEVKELLDEVIDMLDHKLLNDILSYPTSENIAEFIWNELNTRVRKLGVKLYAVKVWEGEGKWVMIEGNEL